MSDQSNGNSPNVNLNVTDIADAVKVIDHACEAGAFRGWTNIRQILALRDRLDLFTTAAAAIPADAPPSEDVSAATVEDDDDEAETMMKTPVANPRRQRGSRMTARS